MMKKLLQDMHEITDFHSCFAKTQYKWYLKFRGIFKNKWNMNGAEFDWVF